MRVCFSSSANGGDANIRVVRTSKGISLQRVMQEGVLVGQRSIRSGARGEKALGYEHALVMLCAVASILLLCKSQD